MISYSTVTDQGQCLSDKPDILLHVESELSVRPYPIYLKSVNMKNLSSLLLLVFVCTSLSAAVTPPADWQYLTANQKNNQAELSWKVTYDRNIAYFDIEQFSISGEWEVIGTIRAESNSSEYRFIDPSPAFGQNHYRIVLYDLNCTATVSNVVTLNYGDNKGFTVYADRNKDGKIKVILPTTSRICIFNDDGSEVYCMPFPAGVQYVDLSNLKKGNYKIRNAGVVKDLTLK